MLNTQTVSALIGDERDASTTSAIHEPVTNQTNPICNIENFSNKILVTNVFEGSYEMNDDTSIDNTLNNANSLCGSDSNNSLNFIRNGVERKDTLTSSSAGSGTIPRTDSNPANHLSPTTSSLSPIQLSPCRSVDSVNDDDMDEIAKLFDTKSKAIERWLKEKASQEILSRIHAASDYARIPKSPKRTSSVTSDLFQLWLASSPVQVRNSCHFNIFLEIIFKSSTHTSYWFYPFVQ